MSEETKFRAWAVMELFGHSRIAGEVSEATIAGETFLRVEVPEVDGVPGFTRFYGAGSIYSITPTTEEIARRAVRVLHVRPITVYGVVLPERQLEAELVDDDEELYPEEFEEEEISF